MKESACPPAMDLEHEQEVLVNLDSSKPLGFGLLVTMTNPSLT